MIDSSIFYVTLAAVIVVLSGVRSTLYRRKRLEGFFGTVGRLEIAFISTLLATLVLLGCLQIVLRNFYHSGVLWADPLMRHLVLWLGCLGAALATTRVRHINIDVFSRIIPARHRGYRRAVVYSVTAVAAYFLGIAALRLVVDERDFGDLAFGVVKTWTLQTVLPFSFFLISYRSLVNLFTGRESRPSDSEMESLEA